MVATRALSVLRGQMILVLVLWVLSIVSSSWGVHEVISELVKVLMVGATASPSLNVHGLVHLVLLIPSLIKVDALVQWDLPEIDGIVLFHVDILLMVVLPL